MAPFLARENPTAINDDQYYYNLCFLNIFAADIGPLMN